MKLEQLEEIKSTIQWLLENGEFKNITSHYSIIANSIDYIEDAIQHLQRIEAKCECGANERIALECGRKSCKHPKYAK